MGTDIHMVVQHRYGQSEWSDLAYPGIGRNYALFAALANVRNGHGFAGVKTGEPIPFIAEPRGLPEDFEINSAYEHHGDQWLGDHSKTWLSLAEVLAYDWDQAKHSQGVVNSENFKAWQTNGRPHEWSGGVSGASVRHVSNSEMARLIALGESTENVYTTVNWALPLRDSIGAQWFALLDWLKTAQSDYVTVRLVFGFDS